MPTLGDVDTVPHTKDVAFTSLPKILPARGEYERQIVWYQAAMSCVY